METGYLSPPRHMNKERMEAPLVPPKVGQLVSPKEFPKVGYSGAQTGGMPTARVMVRPPSKTKVA